MKALKCSLLTPPTNGDPIPLKPYHHHTHVFNLINTQISFSLLSNKLNLELFLFFRIAVISSQSAHLLTKYGPPFSMAWVKSEALFFYLDVRLPDVSWFRDRSGFVVDRGKIMKSSSEIKKRRLSWYGFWDTLEDRPRGGFAWDLSLLRSVNGWSLICCSMGLDWTPSSCVWMLRVLSWNYCLSHPNTSNQRKLRYSFYLKKNFSEKTLRLIIILNKSSDFLHCVKEIVLNKICFSFFFGTESSGGLLAIPLNQICRCFLGYKLRVMFAPSSPLFTLSTRTHVKSPLNKPVLLFLSSLISSSLCFMENNKESFKNVICNDPNPQVTNKNPAISIPGVSSPRAPVLVDLGGSPIEPNFSRATPSKGKEKIDDLPCLDDYLAKLYKVRTDFQQLKQTCLMGFVFGNQIEFAKIRSKLLNEWSKVKGEIRITPKAHRWFEISFSNPIDKNMIWENRPYHVFGQVLALRPWKPNFNTFLESTTILDIWVWIPSIPAEYNNKNAIQTILEYNKVGNFLKLDSYSEKGKGVHYTRICINTDVVDGVINSVPIPDENSPAENRKCKAYPIWYEDFSKGCGFCARSDHVFDSCPLRVFNNKKVKITFKKNNEFGHSVAGPSKTTHVPGLGSDWKAVNPKKSKKNPISSKIEELGFRPYLSGSGDVSVVFNSDSSSARSLSNSKDSKESSHSTPIPHENEVKPTATEPIILADDPPAYGAEHVAALNPLYQELEQVEIPTNIQEIANILGNDQVNQEPNMELMTMEEMVHFFLPDSPAPAAVAPQVSEQSMISFHTGNSTYHKMEAMSMKTSEMSTSGSSKRKNLESVYDTASSLKKGTKKPKM